MYAKCGALPKAHQVFDNLLVQDVVLWTALIAGNTENGYYEEALACLEQMCSKGLSPNATTYVCCLKACANVGSLVKGQEIHAEIARQGAFGMEQAVGNALVNMYAKCDLLNKALEVLLKLPARDVISWTALMVRNLKGVDPKICQHTIPTRDDAKPSRQRPYTYNETFARKIKEEIEKLKEAEFIFEIEHIDWVSPIVVVPRKNGKLRVYVNLKKGNAATIRDNYPLPITEHVLERVAGKEAYSFLDGFLGYNQLLIDPKDQHKTAFAIEWGNFAYKIMPFGLTNALATFQRLMSHAFKEYLRNFLEVYMDDLCVHSSIRVDHFEHLKNVFEKCRLYRICLNPEKCIFMARQGNTLGHIVSKNGIATDMDKIHVIADLPRPTTVKGVQTFMGHCGYYRRFIYMYVIITKPMYGLITLFVWTDECEESFNKLKQALTSAQILKAPDWDKIFQVHVDASNFAIGCILAQPGDGNIDFPISYVSRQLNVAEKNYTTTEQERLGMIYAVKKYRHYLLANKFVFFVDHQALLYLVNKLCNTGRIVRWFIILLEFDFTMVVKNGTTNQREDHLSRTVSGEPPKGVEDDLPDAYLFFVEMIPRWSDSIVSLLTIAQVDSQTPLPLTPGLIGQSAMYQLLAGRLYKKNQDGILLLCINPEEKEQYLTQAHTTIIGIHYAEDQTMQRILRLGVYWPTMRSDIYLFVKSCVQCQIQTPIPHVTLFQVSVVPKWSNYIVTYLLNRTFPEDMSKQHQRAIETEARDYSLIGNQLYRKGKDQHLHLCANEDEYLPILEQAHTRLASGHFSSETTTRAILMVGIWWLTLFADAKEFVRRCDACQRARMPTRVDSMSLQPMMGARAFAKWGIDFVEPIQSPSNSMLTKWAAKATRKNDAQTTAAFLYENVFTRYRLPIEIISDRGTHFLNEVIEYLLSKFMVIHNKSAPYHLQANGQAEHTNKFLSSVLTKVVSTGRTDWEMNLHAALWAYRVSFKTALNATLFNLVYGLDAILPLEFLLPTLRVARDLEWTGHELSERLEDLENLDEQRLMAVAHIYAQKRKLKQFFDSHLLTKIP
ncbi:hypothetical protein L7F22_037746 [Adiantum nelumboides]|nr:hypothetical protein [Adiantum nelumboides]MCO5583831.1 hypothetical protein [Adiantum nelumboides]